MSEFISRDAKCLFLSLCGLCVVFTIAIQLFLFFTVGAFHLILLIMSLLFSGGILVCVQQYFKKQQRVLDDAQAQLDRFAAGDTAARIECDAEGNLSRLFHAVNQMATRLGASAEREQQKKIFLKNTLSDISHQLKTPLAALEIYNTLLMDESDDPAAVAAFAAKSEKEIERMEALVQSLLKITKLDSGSIVMNRQTEQIAELMQEVESRFAVRAEREGKWLVLSGPVDATLLCDRVWLLEAVCNLVKNALDHTQSGNWVELIWNVLPACAQIIVKDNGSGIPPEDLYHIFKRFYRSRFSKDAQGLGLGLPLVKAIVEAHDGTVEVDSVLGEGSAFTMHFLQLTKL